MRVNFQEEYEVEINNELYFVEVEGIKFEEDGEIFTNLENIIIYDSNSLPVDEDNDNYLDIVKDANEREFEIEIHTTDFSYYDIA